MDRGTRRGSALPAGVRRRRPTRRSRGAVALAAVAIAAGAVAIAVGLFGNGVAVRPLPCGARQGIFLGAPPEPVLRPLAQVCAVFERAARHARTGRWTTVLERFGRRAGIPFLVARTAEARARGLRGSVPVVDSGLSGRRRLVAYVRGADGSVWQMTKDLGGRPTFALAGTYDAAVVAAGPIGYWRLADRADPTAADSSGIGMSGIYVGRVFHRAAGPGAFAADAARFIGHGHVKLLLPRISRRPGTTTTVELWLAPDAFPPGSQLQMPFGFRSCDLYLGRTALGFNTGNSDFWGAVVPPLDRGWHYVVAQFSNGSIHGVRLYLDGRRLHLAQQRTPLHPGTSKQSSVSRAAQISGWPADTYDNFYGRIADLAVYPFALSPAQVAAHFSVAARSSTEP